MYVDSLPGNKIISKGNHDYWWTTHSKLSKYLKSLTIENIAFLQNNAYFYNDFSVVGTRGWKNPNDDGFNAEDDKIYNRELERLKLFLIYRWFSGTKISIASFLLFK